MNGEIRNHDFVALRKFFVKIDETADCGFFIVEKNDND